MGYFICFIIGILLVFFITKGNKKSTTQPTQNKNESKEKELQDINNRIAAATNKFKELNDSLAKMQKSCSTSSEALAKMNKALADLEKTRAERITKLNEEKEHEIEQYRQEIQLAKEDIRKDIDYLVSSYNREAASLQKEIDKNQASIDMYIEDQRRKEEMKIKEKFYKISLTQDEIEDVEKLMEISKTLHNSDVLLKLVYKNFFEQKLNDMLGRVVGVNSDISGIYKITNVLEDKSYIGQCVSFKTRWRTHLKRGLGIEAGTSSKLYSAMKEDKVWNFTFEVLEKCPKEQLNDREKFWIDYYHTNTYGYNMKAGG